MMVMRRRFPAFAVAALGGPAFAQALPVGRAGEVDRSRPISQRICARVC